MKASRLIPYLAALLLLAWALASLARTGSGGGSLLFNSHWLFYIIYALPLVPLVFTIILVIALALNYRPVSDAIGYGLHRKRQMQSRKYGKIRLFVTLSSWIIALYVLTARCGGQLFCNTTGTPQNDLTHVAAEVTGSLGAASIEPLNGVVLTASTLIFSDWFPFAFLALIVVSSVIIARSYVVALDQARHEKLVSVEVREGGVTAVREAISILQEEGHVDPRTRVVRCYERMIRAAAHIGMPISNDQTARELEEGIRRTFQLKGRAIKDLTGLFEDARYSLHPVTDTDAEEALKCLVEIGEELNTAI